MLHQLQETVGPSKHDANHCSYISCTTFVDSTIHGCIFQSSTRSTLQSELRAAFGQARQQTHRIDGIDANLREMKQRTATVDQGQLQMREQVDTDSRDARHG